MVFCFAKTLIEELCKKIALDLIKRGVKVGTNNQNRRFAGVHLDSPEERMKLLGEFSDAFLNVYDELLFIIT